MAARLSAMPLVCGYKQRHGREFCVTDCPASAPCGIFEYVRVERPGDVPAPDPRAIDVAVARHEPRLAEPRPRLARPRGARLVLRGDRAAARRQGCGCGCSPTTCAARACCRKRPAAATGSTSAPAARAASTRPRTTASVPRHRAFARTPTWEAPAFALFDAIRADPEAALVAVCHTFGVLCRWSGAARPVLRGPEKGKCTGVLENVLSWQAREHPWFRHFHALLGEAGRLRVVENRLFDLLPARRALALVGAADRLRDPRHRRAARRGGHDDRVRARPHRRRAAGVRREPPPRDRRPLPPGDDPRTEARARRGERGVVPRAARDPHPTRSRGRTSTSGCTSPRTSRCSDRCASTCSGRSASAPRATGCEASTRTRCCGPCSASRWVLCAARPSEARGDDPQAALPQGPHAGARDRGVPAPQAAPRRGLGVADDARGGAAHRPSSSPR